MPGRENMHYHCFSFLFVTESDQRVAVGSDVISQFAEQINESCWRFHPLLTDRSNTEQGQGGLTPVDSSEIFDKRTIHFPVQWSTHEILQVEIRGECWASSNEWFQLRRCPLICILLLRNILRSLWWNGTWLDPCIFQNRIPQIPTAMPNTIQHLNVIRHRSIRCLPSPIGQYPRRSNCLQRRSHLHRRIYRKIRCLQMIHWLNSTQPITGNNLCIPQRVKIARCPRHAHCCRRWQRVVQSRMSFSWNRWNPNPCRVCRTGQLWNLHRSIRSDAQRRQPWARSRLHHVCADDDVTMKIQWITIRTEMFLNWNRNRIIINWPSKACWMRWSSSYCLE